MSIPGFLYMFAVTNLVVTLVLETAEGREGAVDRVVNRAIVKANRVAKIGVGAVQANTWLSSMDSESAGQSSH